MSLEEPEDANAEGLKVSMEHAEHEIGLGSDDAIVNMALYNLLKAEFGDILLPGVVPKPSVGTCNC